jgi:SAM-dependent methyltransferase
MTDADSPDGVGAETTRLVGARAQEDNWDGHWDAYARAAERNPAQRYRRLLALRMLGSAGAPERLVDIGSGQGDLLRAAAGRWPRAALLGLEISERGNEIARAKAPSAEFVLVDLAAGEPVAGRFAGWATHAVCSEVLEHVDVPAAVLRAARKYLAPGARVVVTVPGGPMSAFDRTIGHRRHFTPDDLAEVLAAAGLQTVMVTGAGFPFFNLYRRVVIARGAALAHEISSRGGAPTHAARIAMAAFRPLLAASLPRSPWGTQIVGVAVEPPAVG